MEYAALLLRWHEEVGLEQVDEEKYRVSFCNLELVEFDSSRMRFRRFHAQRRNATGGDLIKSWKGR